MKQKIQQNGEKEPNKKNETGVKKGRPRALPQKQKKIVKEKKTRKVKQQSNQDQFHLQQQEESDSQELEELKGDSATINQFAQQIMGLYMQFFQKVDLRRGFIFDKKQRAILKKQKLGIQWTSQCQWDFQDQKKKIKKVLQKQGLKKQEQINIFMQIANFAGCIFGSESTEQLYTILAKIWIICRQNLTVEQLIDIDLIDKQTRLNELVKNILQNYQERYKFFSFNFSKNYLVNNTILKEQTYQLVQKIQNIFRKVSEKFLRK